MDEAKRKTNRQRGGLKINRKYESWKFVIQNETLPNKRIQSHIIRM